MDKKIPKKKIRTTPILKELLELQSQLIKDHDAIPGKEGYLNWTPARAHEWKTKQKLLEKEKKKLETEFKKATEEEAQFSIKGGLGALFLGGVLQNEGAMGAATAYLAAGIGKKIFGGLSNLFKKKDKKTLENETLENETLDQSSPKPKVGKPEKVEKDAMDPKKIALLQMNGVTGAGDIGIDQGLGKHGDGYFIQPGDKFDRETGKPLPGQEAPASPINRIGSPEKIIKEEISPSDAVRSFYKRGGAAPNELTKGTPEKIETKPGFLMTAENKIRARDERINPKKTIPAGAPEKIETKPGFLMTAENKIRARDERINPKKTIPAGAPEKIEGKKENISSDNDAIISILNKILASFQADNERMRRSIRDAAEKKLESDPTPDTPGAPVKEGDDDKKSGMSKLLMFGAIAGLLIAAYKFKDEIAEILRPVTDMLGITDPLKESNKEDYEFDIMDALGVTALLGMLGIAGVGARAGARAGAGAGAGGGAPEKAGPGNARPRHPAGTVIDGKKVGGQFMKVDPDTIKDVVKKSILKRVGGALGKVLPGLGLAFGLYEAFTRAKDGDLTGAGIALAGGVVGLAPGLGTGASIALMATNIARDVYNDAYGVYPEADESGEKAKRAEEILKEVVKALSPKSPDKPMSGEQRDALTQELTAYSLQIKAERAPGAMPNPGRRKMLAGMVHKKAASIRIDRDIVDTELDVLRKAGAPERDIESNKQLQELTASNAAANAEAGAAAPAPAAAGGAAPSAAGAPAAGGAAPSAAGGAAPSAAGGAAPSAAGAPTSTGVAKGDMPVGSPVPSAPPPASQTSGSAITSATMESSAAQNTITVLPPVINNQTNTSSSNPARESKANKITMQIRMDDEMFRTAVNATAAVLKTLKAA